LGYTNEKLIITDCDGVLLNWEDHFHAYMQSNGHERAYDDSNSYWKEAEYSHLSQDEARKMIYHFNTSSWMIDVPPLRDARVGVAQLVDAGYRFIAITAMGLDPYARQVREINLERTFGYNTFEDVIVTDMYDPNSKRAALLRWGVMGRVWIEDKPSNAVLGSTMGYNTYLMSHRYNEEFDEDEHGIERVNSWADICTNVLPTG